MTGDLRGYVCWVPEDAERVIAPMVESATDAAFLATHVSLPLIPELSRELGRREVVGEADVLAEFLEVDRDPDILAIIGPPGSGKSHVVKWLDAQLRVDPDRLVVYVPREDTNLRRVLTRILDRLPGDDAARLRNDIESATEMLSPEYAAARVLDDIATKLEYDPPPVAADRERQARLLLRGKDDEPGAGLPTLLRHPDVRAALLSPDGVIAANVGVALAQYRPDAGPPPRFTADDIHLASVARDVTGAAAEIRRILGADAQDPQWALFAASLLNSCLDDGIVGLLGLDKSVSLAEVMTDARRLLHAQGRELVLLIEDFALFDRIGGALIDALVVPAGPGRCRMRTAFAITDDPYRRLPETLLSRVGLRFRTGVPIADGNGLELGNAIRFVGRYLNAVRVGPAGLEEAFARALPEERRSGAWVPNKCAACEFRGRCHADDAFEATEDGHGLYPLNPAATERLIHASLGAGRFVPRTLLSDALGPLTTVHARELRDGTFPSPAFQTRVHALPNARDPLLAPVVAEVLQGLEDGGDPDAERRVRTLWLWQPGPTSRATNLSDTVHEAFSLPKLSGDVAPKPVVDRPVTPAARPAPATDPDAVSIDQWLADPDRGLDTELAGKLRRRLHDLVVARIRWNDELLSPALAELREGDMLAQTSFVIEGAAGGRQPKPTAVLFQLPRNATTAVLLKAVLRYDATHAFATAADYVALQDRIDEWAQAVTTALRGGQPGVFPAAAAAEHLVVAALVLGAEPEAYTDPVVAVTETMAGFAVDTATAVSDEWRTFLRSLRADELEPLRLRVVAWSQAAQGDGQVMAFDVARYVSVAERMLPALDVPDLPELAPDELRALHQTLRHGLVGAVDAECGALLDLLADVDWDAASDVASTAEVLLDAVDAAKTVGYFPDPGPFRRRCEDLARLDVTPLDAFSEAAGDLRAESLALRLRGIARCRGAVTVAQQLTELLADATERLDAAAQDLQSERNRLLEGQSQEAADSLLAEQLARVDSLLAAVGEVSA
jgi:hypothetical protein